LRRTKAPSAAAVERLSRKLWEFSEQVRLEALNRLENDGEKNDRERNYRDKNYRDKERRPRA